MDKYSAEVILLNGKRWLNENHIEDGLDHAKLPAFTKKYYSDYRKHRYELADEPKNYI